MRGFGRQCRGQGRVFVPLVRHPERQLLALGQPIQVLGQQAQQLLDHANDLQDAHRQRLTSELHAAMQTQEHIRKQSGRLTQGKKLSHCKIVNAYDPTIAPIIKGKSNGPAQFGRKPGMVSEPATGFIFAHRVPEGNPSDPSYVLPWLDKVQSAIDRVSVPQRFRIHSVAGDLGGNDTALRRALHARGILPVGIPKSVEPIHPAPTPEEIGAILTEAGLRRQRTPHQVQLACACGYSRPVVESHIASLCPAVHRAALRANLRRDVQDAADLRRDVQDAAASPTPSPSPYGLPRRCPWPSRHHDETTGEPRPG
jgi:hypothetical protein